MSSCSQFSKYSAVQYTLGPFVLTITRTLISSQAHSLTDTQKALEFSYLKSGQDFGFQAFPDSIHAKEG